MKKGSLLKGRTECEMREYIFVTLHQGRCDDIPISKRLLSHVLYLHIPAVALLSNKDLGHRKTKNYLLTQFLRVNSLHVTHALRVFRFHTDS